MDDIRVVVGTIVLLAAAVIIGAAAYDHSYRKRGREAIARAAEAHGADFSRSSHGCGRTMIAIDPSRRLLCAAGGKLPDAIVVEAGKVTGVEVGDGSIQITPPKNKSVMGRALLGGVLFGGVGAAVGAASGAGGKAAHDEPLYFLNIFTTDPDLPHHSVAFSDHNSALVWRGLILSMVGQPSGGAPNG